MQIGTEGFIVWDIPQTLGQTWTHDIVKFGISYLTMPAIRQPLIKKKREERERQKE